MEQGLLEQVFKMCELLSVDEKAVLVKRLLGDCEISVVFGSTLHAQTIYQFNFGDNDQMAEVLRAIAQKIPSQT